MLLSITCRRVFCHYHLCSRRAMLLFFCTIYTSMLSSIYLQYCIAVPQAQQRNQPAQSRKASTCRSECNNASKQTEEHLLYCSTTSTAQRSTALHCTALHCTAQHSIAQHITAQSARTKPQSKYVQIRVQQRKYSTSQRNQPAQSRKARKCRSECGNASNQTVLEHMSSIHTAR